MNTASYAQRYVGRGLNVVPIPAHEKGPVIPGWQRLRLGIEDIPRYFNGKPQNVGLLLGEASGV